MNQSRDSSLLASATEDEITVSQVLLDLRELLSLSESLARFNWGCRRRRSCLDEDPPLPRESSPRLPPSVRRTESEIEARRLQSKASAAEEKGGVGTTASPTTPLSFSPSESDDRSKRSSKQASKKRSREDYTDAIEGLTQHRDLLRGEVEKVKKFYDKLKTYNTQLKAMKQEVLNTFPRKREPQMEMNLGPDSTQLHRINVAPHPQPSTADPTAQQNFQYPIGPIQSLLPSSTSGVTCGDHVGPLGIDLNFPATEAYGVDPSQPLDDANEDVADRRARFAEARRKRRGLMRAKSMSSVVKNGQQSDNYENVDL